jgi:hypothetical protein
MIQDAQDLLATTLAASASFRTFVGAGNATVALERIHHDYLPDPDSDVYTLEELQDIRPCALIFTVPDSGWSYDRDAAGTNNWAARGELVCVLMRDTPTGETNSDVDVSMRETAGNIVSDLVDLSEQGGYLASTGFTCNGPYRTEPGELQELGDRQAFEIMIRWGNR